MMVGWLGLVNAMEIGKRFYYRILHQYPKQKRA